MYPDNFHGTLCDTTLCSDSRQPLKADIDRLDAIRAKLDDVRDLIDNAKLESAEATDSLASLRELIDYGDDDYINSAYRAVREGE